MKRKREEFEVFGVSFLDIICCGFGAIVALLMLAKNQPEPEFQTPSPEIVQAKKNEINAVLVKAKQAVQRSTNALKAQIQQINSEIAKKENILKSLKSKNGMSNDKEGAIGTMDSEYDGGIPVGSTHIIFIIDTSGSMQENWNFVVTKVKNIISSHPKVTGLQVLNDMGNSLIPGYDKRWIPDTPSARKNFAQSLKNMSGFSNSSPVEGIERALKIYGANTESLSIYVFGDDFTGSNYDDVLHRVSKLNSRKGAKVARIHGVGFPWGRGDRFATLMRAIAHENNGVYIGL